MKVDLLKKLIKEAVREVLIEELQLPKKTTVNTLPIKEDRNISSVSPSITGNPLQDVLTLTKKELSSRDYSNFIINENVDSNNYIPTVDTGIGLDLSNLDFVKKASSVYNLSKEKDRLK
jgi:hypothetical protein